MKNSIAHVVAFPTETSEGYLWDVSCVDCSENIGTMHSRVLQKALVACFAKGGIKCPSCRAVSCEICGTNILLSRGTMPTTYKVSMWPNPMRLCGVCFLELEQSDTPIVEDKEGTKKNKVTYADLLP